MAWLDRAAGAALEALSPSPLVAEHDRPLQLRTALPALWLMPEQMQLYEGLGEPFELKLQVLSSSAHMDIRSLIGEELTLRLRQPGGGYRSWNGYVLAAAQAGSNGGLARYDKKIAGLWNARLNGERVSFVIVDDSGSLETNLYFDGRVEGDVIDGVIQRGIGNERREIKWRATRIAGS